MKSRPGVGWAHDASVALHSLLGMFGGKVSKDQNGVMKAELLGMSAEYSTVLSDADREELDKSIPTPPKAR